MINERFVVTLQAGEQGAPAWIRLLPWGEIPLGDGREPFFLDHDAAENILTAFAGRGNDMVVDYEHRTMSGDEAPAAGWIKELKIAVEGLWARVDWTDRARQYIENREYRYFSPVVELGEGRVVQDLLHVGLTNFPAIANLPPLILRQGAGKSDMGNERQGEAMIEKLRGSLGLGAEAGEVEVLAALENYRSVMALVQELGQELGLDEANVSTVKGAVLALKSGQDRLTAIDAELTALRQERQQEKAAAAVETAIQAGKVSPAQRDWALKYAGSDPEGFAAFVAAAPKVVPVTEPGEPAKPAGQGVTPEEMQMCRAMGLDPEKFKATRQAERQAAGEVQ